MTAQNIPAVLGRDDVFVMPTRDGSNTLFSRSYNATYHSLFGAVAESKHVFIQHGIKTLEDRPSLDILEFGFGTGLNAFLAYLYSIQTEKIIRYTGIEAYPIDLAVASQLDYAYYLSYPEEGDIFLRMHQEDEFVSDLFHFKKVLQADDLPAGEQYDCIFFDAFAPGTQPALWDQSTFIALFQRLKQGGCLVTYCAQGEVRRSMTKAGFDIQRLAGPPGKREMLRGIKV